MIVVCGEALMDLFPTPGGAGRLIEAVPGGSPYNVAIGLARLGRPAAFLGGLSGDGFGVLLRETLAAEGVDLRFAVASDRLTTLAVVHRGADGGALYAFHGDGKADRMLVEADLPGALPDMCRVLTFGSYTLAVAPVADALLALARREAGRRVISLDPNVRPGVTPDMADWRARFDAFLASADIVKASDEDIRTTYGASVAIDDVAAAWLKAGPNLVFVTLGGEGALAFTADGRRRAAPGRRVQVVDTVGAGDAFHAAALAALDRRGRLAPGALATLSDEDLWATLDYAGAAAAIACTRRGADMPTDAEVAQALPAT